MNVLNGLLYGVLNTSRSLATILDIGMGFILLAALVTGVSKVMNGIENFREPAGKMETFTGAMIMVTPAVLYAVFINLYPGMSDLIGDPSEIDVSDLKLD